MTLETLKIEFQADAAGLERSLDALTAQLGALDQAAQAARPAGSQAASAFALGLAGGAAQARASALKLATSARLDDRGALNRARSAGGALAEGFAEGIRGRSGSALAAARRLAEDAVRELRQRLDIHSPSKVTAALGRHFGAGFAGGILGSAPEAGDAAGHLAAGALARLSAGASEALPAPALTSGLDAAMRRAEQAVGALSAMAAPSAGELPAAASQPQIRTDAVAPINLTIPLNVDGIRLGEAAIRGINAVTRSAGKVLLEL